MAPLLTGGDLSKQIYRRRVFMFLLKQDLFETRPLFPARLPDFSVQCLPVWRESVVSSLK